MFSADPFMSYSVTQLDGVHATGSGGADVCTGTTVRRDQPVDVPFYKGGGYGAEDPDIEWLRAYSNDPLFRLTPGTWQISAFLEASIPGCGGERHDLQADIVIQVTE